MNSMVYFLTVLEVFNNGVHSRTVDITGSTTGFKGRNGTSLECVFTKDNGDLLTTVVFYARNSSTQFEPIVSYSVRRGQIIFFSLWSYLFENVTQELAPVTDSSTSVEIQINHLLCKHEREYKCEVGFEPLIGQVVPKDSNIINITVQVKPSKPESIELLGKLVDNAMLSTTEYSPTGATMESENSRTFTTDLPTQPNNLYESGPITEGDNATFSCSGNVGKPPASFKWEKIQYNGARTTHDDTNTDIIYHSENCSFHRTSNITLQMFAEDNNAIVRCVVAESVISDDKLYAETDPIEVLYKVRLPNITKHPDQEMYGTETKSITLTCHSDGNPKPSYVWSKNSNILHNKSVMVISNVSANDNGTYMCNVSNYGNNEHVMYSTSVSIVIVEEIVTATTRRTTYLMSTPGRVEVRAPDNITDTNVYTIVGVVIAAVVMVVVVVIVIVYKYNQRRSKHRRKTNEGLHDYVNNAANLSPTHYDDLGVMRNESHYDELQHNKHLYTNISSK